jgi:hypothetical protein
MVRQESVTPFSDFFHRHRSATSGGRSLPVEAVPAVLYPAEDAPPARCRIMSTTAPKASNPITHALVSGTAFPTSKSLPQV